MENVRRISKKYYLRQIVACWLMCFMVFYPAVALADVPPAPTALPQTPSTPYGGVGAFNYNTNPLAPRLDILNVQNGAVINWQNFDIGSDATTQFHQVVDSAAVLNRVTGDTGPTGIFGDLIANGTVFIVNTRGIVFGPDSYVQARNLVASGIDLRDRDFRNRDGDFQFEKNTLYPYSNQIGDVEIRGGGTGSIEAEQVALIGRNVTNKGSIVAEGRDNIVVMAAGDKVFLGRDGSDVIVDVDLNFSPFHVVDNGGSQGTGPGTISAPGGKVILAAGDIWSTAIEGVESLRAEAFRNITLEGAATATGDIALIADSDLGHGGDVTTNGAITAGGKVDIAGNLIELNENVSANGGDLTITGRTSKDTSSEGGLNVEWGYIDVAEGKKLFASDDVIVKDAFGSGGDEPPAGKMDLFGHVSLEIEAEGGEIKTEGPWDPDGVKITVQNTSPASLTMTQADPLDLGLYTFGNQENTDLTLVSYNSSVKAVDFGHGGKNENAADQWASIGATAFTDITLQGHDLERDITATALTSNAADPYTGNISVTSDNRKVRATGEINANNGSVTLSAINPDNGGIELHANVTSSDFQDYIGDVELKNDVTAESTGGSDITFTGTIDGTHGLTVNTAGVTKFQDEIGGNERLASLTTDAPGRTEIEADIYLNGASATFGDPVLLKNNLTIDEAGTGNIEFASTVDSKEGSNYTLTVNSGSGATIFGGAVGNDALDELSDDEGLGEVTTNAAGTTQINGGSVTTTGNQTYNDPVTLGAATTELNGSGVEFVSTLNGASALTVNTTGGGSTIFGGTVGNSTALTSLVTNADGDTKINGGLVTTTGNQTYNDPVTLGAYTTLNATNVTFDQTLDSDSGNNRVLYVLASGVTKFNGAVGATDPLYWLWTDGFGSTQINGGSVTTTSLQIYDDPVTLGADTTLNGQHVEFWNTLNSDSAGTPRTLLVNASAETYFGAPVGGIAPLASLETDAPGRTFIFADVTTTGAQTYRDPVEIYDGVITTKSNNGGNITFAQTVDSLYTYWLSGPVGLSVETAGVTRFQGEVGGNNPLASLTTDAPGRTEIGAVNIHLNGASAKFNDPVLLMDNLTINEAGTGNIEFASTVDSEEGSNYNLTVNSGSGATIFGGAVGSNALGVLSDDEGLGAVTTNAAGSTQINGGSVKTTGDQTYNDPVTLGVTYTMLNATNVTFDQTLDSDSGNDRGLDVWASGVTKFNGAVGGTDPLYWLYTDWSGSTQINGGSVTATYNQVYNDPVSLGADTTLNSQYVYFLNTLNSDSAGTPRNLLVNAYGTKFLKEVGGIAPLASLETDAPGWTYLWADVTTTGPQTYNDDVDLKGDVIAESTGDDDITFAKTVDGAHNLTVNTAGNTRFGGNVGSDIPLTTLTTDAGGTTYVSGDVTTTSGITFGDNVIADGTGSPLDQTLKVENGTLTAEGWVWKTTAGNLYLLSNNDDPEHNNGKAIDLQYAGCLPAASTALGNLELYAENGDIQISGDLTTFGLYEFGGRVEGVENGNGSCLDKWYDRPTGGVSVIAENGKIYTDADSPDPEAGDYMLNIGIVGNSDDVSHRIVPGNGNGYFQIGMPQLGVDLPDGEGKAAIVVMSSEDLIFGPDTILIAKGTYDDSVVDDRPGVDFLADPLTSIGGVIRDEGDPIDVAIYVASTGTDTDPAAGQGNVHLDGRAIDVADGGTMVVDAYDTVTFGDFETFNLEDFDGCEDLGCFLKKLAMRFHEDIDFEDLCGAFGEYVGQYGWYEGVLEDFLNFYFDEGFFFNIGRLEAASRISEWLFQAVGRLPYAGDPAGIAAIEAFIGGDYILRGAGLGNPGIIDGRAWVLEDPLSPAPLYREAGEKAEEQAIGAEGCPALLTAAALELGIAEDELNVFMASAMAAATDIQPCESCARLVDAATILRDEDGSRMAAMIQVFNELAPADAPFTPEMATSIVTAFAGHVDDGTYYATAIEYIDAFVQYIAVLDTEMGSPVGEGDSVAFVMEKHGAGITESDNANIGAFVATRLEGLETFGD